MTSLHHRAQRIVFFCVGLTLPLVTGPVRSSAQDTPAPDDPASSDLVSDDVVVTGTRTEVPLADSPSRVEVITRAQIDASGSRDVAELLEERPGIVVQQTFRGTQITMDGLDPEYTLILVDGDRVPGRIGGAIDLGRYSLEDIERVEIVRGPSSALYGSDAIAGVVNIITRMPTEPFAADGALNYGYFGQGSTVDLTADAAGRYDVVAARVSGGYHFSDPWSRGSGPSTTGSRRDQWSVGGHVYLEPLRGLRLDARVEYLSRQLTGVDTNDAGAVFDRTQLGEQLQVSIGERLHTGEGTDLVARITYASFREQYLYDQRGSQALDDYQDNREQTGQITLQLDHSFHTGSIGDHRVSVGVEGYRQDLDSLRLVTSGHRARVSPFVQDEWTIVDDGELLLVAVIGARLDVDSQFGEQLSPRVGLRFDPVSQVVLRATYGLGFRAPSFQELFLRFENPSVGYIVAGNPTLGAERSRGLRVGGDWTPIAEISFGADYFRNDLDDMIATVTAADTSAGTRFTYANIASAYTQGLETRSTLRPIHELSFQLSYVLTDTRDAALNRPLEGRPFHRFTLGGSFAHEETGLSATVRTAISLDRNYYVDVDADGLEDVVTPGPLVSTDVRVGLSLFDHLELFVGVDNVFDAYDAYFVSRPRTFFVGVRGRS
ncbi:MAG: TonB-dependent receptor [Sandaracinus sp.]